MQTYTSDPQIYTKKSLLSVLWQKAIDYVERKKARHLLKRAGELLGGLLLGAIVAKPDIIAGYIFTLLKTENYIIPKIVAGVALIFSRRAIMRFYYRLRAPKVEDEEEQIDNIPVVELTDYLIRNKHFKREGVNGVRKTFGLNMERFNDLANKLEENKVLIRGEKNARFLSGKWSRQALIDYLSSYEKSQEMKPYFRVRQISPNAKVRLDRQEIEAAAIS